MDDCDDFEDIFEEDEMLLDSQESLTAAAANLVFDDFSDEMLDDFLPTPATSQDSQDLAVNAGSDTDTGNPPKQPDTSPQPGTVLEQIESIFDQITRTLTDQNGMLTIRLKVRPNPATFRQSSSGATSAKTKSVSFPGKTATEAWRFTVVIRILELMHEALSAGVLLSKRDLYYRDPALFGSQAVVDRYVDNIAYTFSVPRSKLNVTAAAKGLVAGAFHICRRDGSTTNGIDDRDGILVPALRDILSVDVTAVKWILVIEKEATFRSIASSAFWDTISACGVIITGKGYPDIATRALLHLLSMATPQNGFVSPPVFGLADCDPDGLAILSIYRNGSAALTHENDDLRVPQLQWLGLQTDHMMGESLLHSSQGLLSLTKRDRRRAVKLLERNAGTSSETELRMSRALQTMLMLNTKAELQLLDSVPNGTTSLLESRLDHV